MSKKNEVNALIVVDMTLPSGKTARLVSDCQIGIAILAWVLTYNIWLANRRRKFESALRSAEELYLGLSSC